MLQSQFRYNGSDGYLVWEDNPLQIEETVNEDFQGIDYDFRVFDYPTALRNRLLRQPPYRSGAGLRLYRSYYRRRSHHTQWCRAGRSYQARQGR